MTPISPLPTAGPPFRRFFESPRGYVPVSSSRRYLAAHGGRVSAIGVGRSRASTDALPADLSTALGFRAAATSITAASVERLVVAVVTVATHKVVALRRGSKGTRGDQGNCRDDGGELHGCEPGGMF